MSCGAGQVRAYLPDHHPDAIFYRDAAAGQVVLNSGARVPVLAYRSTCGEALHPTELAELDEFCVVYGPTPSGQIMHAHVWPQRVGLAA